MSNIYTIYSCPTGYNEIPADDPLHVRKAALRHCTKKTSGSFIDTTFLNEARRLTTMVPRQNLVLLWSKKDADKPSPIEGKKTAWAWDTPDLNGFLTQKENLAFSAYITRCFVNQERDEDAVELGLPGFSPAVRETVTHAFIGAYAEAASSPNFPYAELSAEATYDLKNYVVGREEMLTKTRAAVVQDLQDLYPAVKKTSWEIYDTARDTVSDPANPACAAKPEEADLSKFALPCRVDFYSAEHYYNLSTCANGVSQILDAPETEKDVDRYVDGISRLCDRIWGWDEKGLLEKEDYDRLLPPLYKLRSMLEAKRRRLWMIDRKLEETRPFAFELKLAGDRLPLVVPAVFRKNDAVWETEVPAINLPPNPNELSLVNAEGFLRYWDETKAFEPGDVTPLPVKTGNFEIGLGHVVEITYDQTWYTLQLMIPFKEALARIVNTPPDREEYLGRIGEFVDRIVFVSPSEMRKMWLNHLKKKAMAAGRFLYSEPDETRYLIYEIFYGLQFVPLGFYSDKTIYLSSGLSDFKDVFLHELAHATHNAFAAGNVLTEPAFRTIDKKLNELMKTDQNKISHDPYLIFGGRNAADEWRTDALKEYWTNPKNLESVDDHLYRFYYHLHHDAEEKYADWEQRKPDEPRYYLLVSPADPFDPKNQANRQFYALSFFEIRQPPPLVDAQTTLGIKK